MDRRHQIGKESPADGGQRWQWRIRQDARVGRRRRVADPLRPQGFGHGWIPGKKSRLEKLSEEHGVVRVEPGESFRIGERVRVLPNHACVVSNLHDRVTLARGDRVEGEWTVAARGRVR